MKIPNKEIVQLVKDIQGSKNNKVVIIPHVNPDGDAIGASMALYYYFSKTNKVDVIAPSHFPEFLKWIPNSEEVLDYKKQKDKSDELVLNADLIIIADHNAANRSGDIEESIAVSKAKKLMIDHHPEPSYPVDFQISEILVSSTSELVYNFISEINNSAFDREIASAIYVGIMTDTGNFMHNVHPDTFKIVSNLMEYKIDREFIYNQVFNNYSLERMQLLGYTLSDKMEFLESVGTVILSLNKKELDKFSYQVGDTEGFVNMPLAIQGVNSSILVMERDEEVKLSFRSKGEIAINKIAKEYFNGGGHKNAAGGSEKELSVEATVQKLKEILLKNKQILIN